MGRVVRYGVRLAAGLAILTAAAAAWLAVAPPELLRVGTGYAAKIVCSNVFIAGRDPQDILAEDVQAPGNPLLRFLRVAVDRDSRDVTAYIFGVFAPNHAVFRPGLGCTSVPDGNLAAARRIALPASAMADPPAASASAPWPDGTGEAAADPAIARLLADPALIGPDMRAVLVVRDGQLVSEAYGRGFNRATPLIGWSMTKTATAMLVGRRIGEGGMRLDQDRLASDWGDVPARDERARITLQQLMGMESGLAFNENYGTVSDVTRMLFLEPDQAGFVARQPLVANPGSEFSYSTGTSVLISRVLMNSLPADERLAYPRKALFAPLGMTSAVLEADEVGTFSGGSYLYANARDWAKLGQLLLQDGVWKGQRLLPEGYVAWMMKPTVVSAGLYAQGQIWRAGPGNAPSTAFGLPDDTRWFQGHDGQSMAIVPSRNLVVLRMGLTPGRLGYRPQTLLKAILGPAP